MTMRNTILAAVGVAVFCSCSSLYKAYDGKPDVPLGVMGNTIQTDDTVSIGAIGWREMFQDPLLQQLIERGLKNNTDLKAAQLTVEQAQNDLRAVRLGDLPTLSFNPTGALQHFNKATTYPYTVPVTATWQLNIFGQTTSKRRQQEARMEMYHDYKQAVETSLAANIANTYYSLVLLDRKLQILEETKTVWEMSLESMRTLYEAGVYQSPAVYQMEASLANVQAGIVEMQESILTAEAALCLLLSEVPHHIQRSPYGTFSIPERLSVGIPVRLLSVRPDVRQAARKMEIAYYDVQQAQQAFYPNIVITADAGWGNDKGKVNPGRFIAEAIASLTQPIFAQGKLKAKYRNAKLEQEKASVHFSQTLLNAGNEVYRYMHACMKTEQKVKYLSERVKSLNEAYVATQELMINGTNTYLEVLKAQEDLLTAQLDEAENSFSGVQAFVNLYVALGGFWEKGQ